MIISYNITPYRDSDANNLQQFESLMSLTNLLSCGETEHNKFVHDKYVAYFLIVVVHLTVDYC